MKIQTILAGMLTLVALTAASCGGSANITADVNNEDSNSIDVNADVSATTPAAAKTVTVSYTASGFGPATVTINKGDKVRFVNNSSSAFWPASAPHPIHTGLPGFDAKRNIAPGGTYEFTFTTTGSFGYHNHLNPTQTGRVTVN